MSKEALKEKVNRITELATSFCAQQLNDEYFALAEEVIGKLSRKSPSPLLRGKEEIWAAGVIHAIGHVNFLYDEEYQKMVREARENGEDIQFWTN